MQANTSNTFPGSMRRAQHLGIALALFSLQVGVATPQTESGLHNSASQQTPAEQQLRDATTAAAYSHKNVLLVFTASWCVPCHAFLAFLNDRSIRPIVERAFVVTVLSDGERPTDPTNHNTVGAAEIRTMYHGRSAGLPYFVMISSAGNKIVDSVRPLYGGRNEHANIGYPSGPIGRAWFKQMLLLGAPSLSSAEIREVDIWLENHNGSH